MKIVCETCDHSSRTFSDWMEHLVSSRHQVRTAPLVVSWPKNLVLVVRPKLPQRTLQSSAHDLIWHFSTCGLIADVHYPQDMSFCLIHFDESDSLTYSTKYDDINGIRLIVKRWNQLSRAEANQMMGNPSPQPQSPAPPLNVDASKRKPNPSLPQPTAAASISVGEPVESPPGQPRPQLPHTPPPAGHRYVPPSSLRNGGRAAAAPIASPFPSAPTASLNNSNAAVDKKTSTPPQPGKSGTAGKGAGPKKTRDGTTEVPMDPFERRHLGLSRHHENAGLDLDQQLVHWVQEVTLAADDMTRRSVVLADLQRSLQSDERAKNALLFPFGSYITGLGDKDSDLDIYVNYQGAQMDQDEGPLNQPLSANTKRQLLDITKSILRRQRGRFQRLLSIRTARVPILKATHFSGIQMDLSFENITSVKNSELIAFYQCFDPRAKYLMLFVRYWAKFHRLSGSVLIKNYALVLLVIVFLVRKGLAPSVHTLQTLASKKLLVDSWNVGFSTDMRLIRARMKERPWCPAGDVEACEISRRTQYPTARSFLAMAADFFDMFGKLDYSQLVVCSLTAEFLPKTQFEPGYEVELPSSLDLYKAWAFKQSRETRFDARRPFCLQDPFQLDFNVGTCVKQELIDDFAASCGEAATGIRAVLQQNDLQKSLLSVLVVRPKKLTKAERRRLRRTPGRAAAGANGVPNQPMCSFRLVPGPYFSKETLFVNFGTSELGEEDESRLMSLWCMYVKEFFKALLTDAYKMKVRVLDLPPPEPADTEPRDEHEPREKKDNTLAPSGTSSEADGDEGGRHKRRLPESPPNEEGADISKEAGAALTTKPLPKIVKTEATAANGNEQDTGEQKMEHTPRANEQMDYGPAKLQALLYALRQIPALEEHANARLAVSATCHPLFNQNHNRLVQQIRKEEDTQVGGNGTKDLENPFRLEAEAALRATTKTAKTESRRVKEVTFEVFGRVELERRRRGSTEAMSVVPVFVIEVRQDLFCAWFLAKKYSELLEPYLQHRLHQWMLSA